MSPILLLQRRNDYGETINKYISADTLDKAYLNTKSALHFEQSMSTDLAESIQGVLKVGPQDYQMEYSSAFAHLSSSCSFVVFYHKDLEGNNIGNTAARMRLLTLVESANTFEKMLSWQ